MKISPTQKKSILVSIVTAGCEVIAFCICSVLIAGPVLMAARWLLGVTGAVANFTLNRRWAFAESRAHDATAQGLRYALTVGAGVTLATLLWWAVVSLTDWNTRVVHVVTMMAVWLSFTYPMFKVWVFAQDPHDADLEDWSAVARRC